MKGFCVMVCDVILSIVSSIGCFLLIDFKVAGLCRWDSALQFAALYVTSSQVVSLVYMLSKSLH